MIPVIGVLPHQEKTDSGCSFERDTRARVLKLEPAPSGEDRSAREWVTGGVATRLVRETITSLIGVLRAVPMTAIAELLVAMLGVVLSALGVVQSPFPVEFLEAVVLVEGLWGEEGVPFDSVFPHTEHGVQ